MFTLSGPQITSIFGWCKQQAKEKQIDWQDRKALRCDTGFNRGTIEKIVLSKLEELRN
jgi:hypothetical protein